MTLLRYTAFVLFGLAALAAIGALAMEEPTLLSGSLVAGLLGVAFLGGAEALRLLGEIRDAVAEPWADGVASEADLADLAGDAASPPRSLHALSADLERFKSRA